MSKTKKTPTTLATITALPHGSPERSIAFHAFCQTLLARKAAQAK